MEKFYIANDTFVTNASSEKEASDLFKASDYVQENIASAHEELSVRSYNRYSIEHEIQCVMASVSDKYNSPYLTYPRSMRKDINLDEWISGETGNLYKCALCFDDCRSEGIYSLRIEALPFDTVNPSFSIDIPLICGGKIATDLVLTGIDESLKKFVSLIKKSILIKGEK